MEMGENAEDAIIQLKPINLQNGHKNSTRIINKKARSADLEYKKKAKVATRGRAAALCSMCGQREPHALVDLSGNVVMKKTLTSYSKLPQEKLESTLKSLCVQCVYKINAQKEIYVQSLKNGGADAECKLYKIKMTVDATATKGKRQQTQLPRKARSSCSWGMESESSSPLSFAAVASPNIPLTVTTPKTQVPAAIDIIRDCSLMLTPEPLRSAEVGNLDNITTAATTVCNTPSAINLSLDMQRKHRRSMRNKTEVRDSKSDTNFELNDKMVKRLIDGKTNGLHDQEHRKRRKSHTSKRPDKKEVTRGTSPVVNVSNEQSQQQCMTLEQNEQTQSLPTKEKLAMPINNKKPCEELPTQTATKQPDLLDQSSATILPIIAAKNVDEPTTTSAAAAVTTSHKPTSSSKTSLANNSAKCQSTDSCNSNAGYSNQNSMLEVLNESNAELAFNTESGQSTYNRQHVAQAPRFCCKYCGLTYMSRKKNYTKHVRRCPVRYGKTTNNKTAASAAAAAAAMTQDTGIALLSNTSTPQQRMPRTRTYYCGECDETFDNLSKLREHERTHLVHRYCELCNESFTAPHAYEFHCILCDAKHEALNELASEADNADDTNLQNYSQPVRITRSRSRLVSICLSRAVSRISYSNCSYYNDDDDDNDDDESNEDAEEDNHGYGNSEDSDDDDEVSVADTMYTKRMRYTGDWIEGNSNSNSSSCQSLYGERLYNYAVEQPMTEKEYDLYLLDRLKYEKQIKTFTCFVPGCNYVTDTLLEIMIHDYKHHFKHAWFYCNKCGRVFTSKVYLDYHLDRQDGGRFMCYKCGDIFEFQHQLDRHLICHTKSLNYQCNYCKFEFLSKSELLQHCQIDGHDPNGERKLICIDRAMTISNPVPPAPSLKRKIYIIHDLRLKSLPMPSKRPMELPKYEIHQRRIGDVEFKNQKNPNCLGWK